MPERRYGDGLELVGEYEAWSRRKCERWTASGVGDSFFNTTVVKWTVDDGAAQGNPKREPHLHEADPCLLVDLPVETGVEGGKDSSYGCLATASRVGNDRNFRSNIERDFPGLGQSELDTWTKGDRVLELAVAQAANDGI